MPTWSVIVDDQFTRADSANGNPGNSWVDALNGFAISSNRLTVLASTGATTGLTRICYRPTSEATTTQRAEFWFYHATSSSGGGFPLLLMRVQGGSYYFVQVGGGTAINPGRYISGAQTSLTSKTLVAALTVGTLYRLDMEVINNAAGTQVTLNFTLKQSNGTVIDTHSVVDSTPGILVNPGTIGVGALINSGTAQQQYWDQITYYQGATISANPNSISPSTTTNVTVAGVGTSWLTSAPNFTLTGGTGAAINSTTVNSNTSVTLNISTGSAYATLTLTETVADAATSIYVEESIVPGDTNLVLSPYNWLVNGGVAKSNNPGAYAKCTFNGTTLIAYFDPSSLIGTSPTAYPTVRAIIDSVDRGSYQIGPNSTRVVLTSGITSGLHNAILVFETTDATNDRWATPKNLLTLTRVAAQGSFAAQSINSGRGIIFGDSITEGANGTAINATEAYSTVFGESLGTEYGVIGFSAQGWTATGGGGVPVFASTWNNFWSGQARSFTIPPDWVLINHGTNDGSATDAAVQTQVQNVLTAMRAAFGGTTKIGILIPFGRTRATGVANGANAYKTASGDINVFLLDCGATAQRGIATTSNLPNYFSTDRVHPRSWRHGALGALVAAKWKEATTKQKKSTVVTV